MCKPLRPNLPADDEYVSPQCLIVSNDFAPQIAPLRGAELELLHWTLLQTRGVGFYNSNLLAGASQAHRHVQFIPGDAIWRLRNPDAAHVSHFG